MRNKTHIPFLKRTSDHTKFSLDLPRAPLTSSASTPAPRFPTGGGGHVPPPPTSKPTHLYLLLHPDISSLVKDGNCIICLRRCFVDGLCRDLAVGDFRQADKETRRLRTTPTTKPTNVFSLLKQHGFIFSAASLSPRVKIDGDIAEVIFETL